MKARLVPVYFKSGRDAVFNKQVDTLRGLLAEEAEILEPVTLGSPLPDAEAAVFPQILGDVYRQVNDFKWFRPLRWDVPDSPTHNGGCPLFRRR